MTLRATSSDVVPREAEARPPKFGGYTRYGIAKRDENIEKRARKGSSGWEKYAIVKDREELEGRSRSRPKYEKYAIAKE
jgi:hypothetical protein